MKHNNKKHTIKNKMKKLNPTQHKKTYKSNKKINKKAYLDKKGGNPKINFAYTYLTIDYKTFQQNLNNFQLLNKYIIQKSHDCNCRSINSPMNQCNYPTQQLMINNEKESIILVLKYNDFVDVTNNISLFLDPNFLNKILGHCKIIQYIVNEKQIIGIYNVCLHLTEKKGYGSVLFNSILTAINFIKNIPDDSLLWLGINLQNVQFEKLANLYTNRGFGNPYIDTKDVNGAETGFTFIALTKYKGIYITNEDTTSIAYAETLDLYQQSAKEKIEPNYAPRFQFSLDNSAILSLRLFPYIGHEGITNIITKNLQFESSGIFHIFNAIINEDINKNIIYKLSLETIADNKAIKYNVGKAESVIYPIGCCSFHSHPIAAYVNHKVLIGPPSGNDYVGFYSGLKDYFNQFHMIVSIEGIYLISLSQEILQNKTFYTNYNLNPDFLNQMRFDYQYPMKNPQYYFDWVSNDNIDPSLVPKALNSYFEWFKIVNQKYQNLFQLQIFYWKDLQRDTIVQIFYSKYNGKIFTPVKMPNTYPNYTI